MKECTDYCFTCGDCNDCFPHPWCEEHETCSNDCLTKEHKPEPPAPTDDKGIGMALSNFQAKFGSPGEAGE